MLQMWMRVEDAFTRAFLVPNESNGLARVQMIESGRQRVNLSALEPKLFELSMILAARVEMTSEKDEHNTINK